MPTLFRILRAFAFVGLILYAAAYALVTYVEPARRPMATPVPVILSELQWTATRS